MHTVVFGWFGVSALWFVPLAARLAIAFLARDHTAGGRGTIRLWLGFASVFIGSGALEAALAPHTGNALGHAVLAAALRLLGRGAYAAMPVLVLAGLPWLMGSSWRATLRWADRAFGLGLNIRAGGGSSGAPTSTRDEGTRMARGAASGSIVRATMSNAMAPRSTGRYARPTVWQPPPTTGAKGRPSATPAATRGGLGDARAAHPKPMDTAAPARGAMPGTARRSIEPSGGVHPYSTVSRAPGPAVTHSAALPNTPRAPHRQDTEPPVPQRHAGAPRQPGNAAPDTTDYAALRATQSAAAVATATAGAPAAQSFGPRSNSAAPIRRHESNGWSHPSARPSAPQKAVVAPADAAQRRGEPAAPSPGVLETLRAIEANAAQWTALASSSLARRGAAVAPPQETVRTNALSDGPAGESAVTGAVAPQASASESARAHDAPAQVSAHHANEDAAAPPVVAPPPVQQAPEHIESAANEPEAASASAQTRVAQRSTGESIEEASAHVTPPWVADDEPPAAPRTEEPVADTAPAESLPTAPPAPVLLELAPLPRRDEHSSAPGLPASSASAVSPTGAPAAAAAATPAPTPAPTPALSPTPTPTTTPPPAPVTTEARIPASPPSPPQPTRMAEQAPPVAPQAPAAAGALSASPDAAQTPSAAPADSSARGPLRGHAPTEFTFHAPAASLVELPSLDLLEPASTQTEEIPAERLAETGQIIEQRLQEFKVPVTVVGASAGPVITRFEIEPALGVRGSQIVGLMKDLSRGLGLTSIRVVETIPGKTCMGLELPNAKRQTIRLSEILDASSYRHSASKLTIAMGKDITGHPIVTDLAKAPHMLVAGTTGSGKSVAINAMIVSLLFKATPEEVRLIMIDPKMLELSVYEGIPHLLAPVVTDMKLAANALNWCVGEMEKRYRLMSAVGVRNLAGFNQKLRDAQAAGKKIGNPFSLTPDAPEPLSPLPLIVVVIDELADLMMVAGKKIEELIARLAQKARAAGIHLILATQRPSVDVITGLIKANIPTRVAFQVSSKIDSRTILDQMGAESLLGQGDMLFLPPGTGYPQRVHGAFVADEEVHRVVEHLKQFGEPQYEEGILDGPAGEGAAQDLFGDAPDAEADPLYDEAVAFVVRTRRASISAVQRQLRIGYNRAARLVEQMEAAGLVSSMGVNGSREVIAPPSSEA